MREFFGFDEYQREPEGYLSWQHLLFVTLLMIAMTAIAVWLGRRYKNADPDRKNRVLIVAAILIDALELFKIVIFCVRASDPWGWLDWLPLFLCSIQLITLPLAAFSRGRLKEASLDFVVIFGLLGAVMGTYFAGNNYAAYPVLCFDNVVSGITHCIAGFAAIYIVLAGMCSMKKKNISITFAVLLSFCVAAYVANLFLDRNYMFLLRGDGTPYDIFYNLYNGNQILYPLTVVGLFLIYIALFYWVYYLIAQKRTKKA